jgi:transaldolase
MSKLHDLARHGQSIWLDNLHRDLLASGELERMIEDDAISGITSNPTILAAALSASDDYDAHVAVLAREGSSATEIYSMLVADDIRKACDVLRDVWEQKERLDGFVSVEVSPTVADDVEATVAEAHDWVKLIDRDNLLVKVPATRAGVKAIERLTAEGVSVNVTLIFSLDRYRAVVEAYLSGLETFAAAGGDLRRVVSFASFFVSRVDTEVDRRLDEIATPVAQALRGDAGIANARTAYGIFGELFSGDRWERLAARGANLQKPLWASTGVKDPAYRDTLYVEELIAPNTVNTMPEATMAAFQDHGDPSKGPFGTDAISEARSTLEALHSIGIDVEKIADDVLAVEGVAKFEKSFTELIEGLEAKRAESS